MILLSVAYICKSERRQRLLYVKVSDLTSGRLCGLYGLQSTLG